ncbi:MAG: hypothetical protein JGK30_00195 [Microcoleus sp. PH2017_40_RAT_O_B]|jgi:hypothetical protein|uniref:hypothetical protein n=1 Tax=unclassified Microcoleus TaxID=2642155 RepID=UPI001D5AA1B2|nr:MULTISPECIES: hypothetical protein [unclassified Microcoleus]MCC3570520.1 hypothetical protein [Microcoleus sp. PH2017_34_RAT_O_A]MCC3607961.1 hypothetical protein [Microcoleus sp. PH2017_40_RAT_O_B]
MESLSNNWDELAKILEPIHISLLAPQHLESCNYKIRGYWDSNKFYEEIAFIHPICAELIARSIGTNIINNHPTSHWIKLKFLLKADLSAGENNLVSDNGDDEIGELTLILDGNLKVIDENWLIDIESPFVVAKIQPVCSILPKVREG